MGDNMKYIVIVFLALFLNIGRVEASDVEKPYCWVLAEYLNEKTKSLSHEIEILKASMKKSGRRFFSEEQIRLRQFGSRGHLSVLDDIPTMENSKCHDLLIEYANIAKKQRNGYLTYYKTDVAFARKIANDTEELK